MPISASVARRLLALAALGPVAAIAAACGTPSSSSSATGTVSTVPAVATPSSGGTPSTSQAESTPAGPGECTTAALHVRIGSSNGAAGTIYYDIVFTNASSTTCFRQGYPGVSLVSAGTPSGSQIGADAKRDPVAPSRQVVLAAGQTAHAVLGVAEAGNFPVPKCNPVTAHWLRVFPPDQTAAAYAPFTTQTCASTSLSTMRITTISSGA